jgi:thiol-disulfide isomerase/thioredoxin
MKKCAFSLMLLLLISCSEDQAPKTILYGEFTSDDSTKIPSEIYLKYTNHLNIVYEQVLFDTLKVKDGKFLAEYDTEEALKLYATDNCANSYFRKNIFLFPSDSLRVDIHADTSGEITLTFNSGQKALFNKIANELYNFGDDLGRYFAYNENRDELHFSNDSLKKVKMDYLLHYSPELDSKEKESKLYKEKLSKEEFKYIKSLIDTEWAWNKVDNTLMTQFWTYYEETVDTFDFFEYNSLDKNSQFDNLYPYTALIKRMGNIETYRVLAQTTSDSGRLNPNDRLLARYKYLKTKYTGIEQDIMISEMLSRKLKYYTSLDFFHLADSLRKIYTDQNKKSLFTDNLESYAKKIEKMLPGNKAPDLTQVDINGDTLSLSDFKGKVVYIDFWGLGCGPCMQEMEPTRKLEEKYINEENLVFIKISNSSKRNFQANLDYVIKEKLGGINIVTADDVASKSFLVGGIPRYFLIDKSGNIANPNAPRPSSLEKLSIELDSLLSL